MKNKRTYKKSQSIYKKAEAKITPQLIESYFPGGKWRNEEYIVNSPLRNDNNPGSFSIRNNGLFYDFATNDKGNFITLVSRAKGITPLEAAKEIAGDDYHFETNNNKKSNGKSKPTAVIPFPESSIDDLKEYVNEEWCVQKWGTPKEYYVYRTTEGPWMITVRFETETGKNTIPFYYTIENKWKAARPTIKGEYPLYGIEKLKPGDNVLIVEGEKCGNVHVEGYISLSWLGGANQAHLSDFTLLQSHNVVIWPDNDGPGYEAAHYIKSLLPNAKILKIINRPEKWDIADAQKEGIDLVTFLRECPVDNHTELNADETDLTVIVPKAWKAIHDNNTPPRLFLYGAKPARLLYDDENPIIEHLDKMMLQYESARASIWVVITQNGFDQVRPPTGIIDSMRAYDEIPLPKLYRIVSAPVFSPLGKIETEPGYHEGSRTFYHPKNLKIGKIPDVPSVNDLDESLKILNYMLQDFPFVNQSDKAHAFSLMLTPFVRAMIDGPVPLHVGESSTPGTGKSLLTSLLLNPATGGKFNTMSPSHNEEEERKRITAALSRAPEAVVIDNVYDLSSSQLAALLTCDVWSDRILGKSMTVSYPVLAVFAATGNNISMSTEMARRVIRFRIEAIIEKPWLRTGFAINNISEWVCMHRTELITACIILVQNWIAQGMPRPKIKPLGRFESWSYVMGGILECAGIDGFLDNILEMYDEVDVESGAWRRLLTEWFNTFGYRAVTAAELYEIASAIDGLPITGRDDSSMKKSFGKALSKQRQRIFSIDDNKFQILKGADKSKTGTWRLKNIDKQG